MKYSDLKVWKVRMRVEDCFGRVNDNRIKVAKPRDSGYQQCERTRIGDRDIKRKGMEAMRVKSVDQGEHRIQC